MKKQFVVLAVVILLFSGVLCAQEEGFELSAGSIYYGESAISSGYGAVVAFTSKMRSLTFEFNNDLSQVVYTQTIKGFTFGPSGGIQKNAPWLAPYLQYNIGKYVSFVSWNGFFFGEPENPRWDIAFGFAYHAVAIDLAWTKLLIVQNMSVGVSGLKYLQLDDMVLPSATYAWNFSKKDKFTASLTYKFSDDGDGVMYFFAIHRSF